jgi:hypothetical protein
VAKPRKEATVMAVSRREGFVQLGENLVNLRCVEMVFIDPHHRVFITLSSGRTIELSGEDAIDFLSFLGNVIDILDEADEAWKVRERDADEPLEDTEW